VVKCDANGKKGMLSCCKCLFDWIGANLAHIQPENLLNVQKMRFWQKTPGVNGLNMLEWRLIAPRLAFQKLMKATRGKQLKITGNVLNILVPADVCSTVNLLPRLENETGTIKVKLDCRFHDYKSSALSLNVRPHKVIQAAF